MRRSVLLLAAILILPGCLVHEARIDGPVTGPDDEGRLWINRSETSLPASPPLHHEERGGKPRDIPVSCYVYRRDENGTLLRWDGHVRTALPWWQRFPCDIAVDYWPQEVSVPVATQLHPIPVPERDPADLLAEARRHGYAR